MSPPPALPAAAADAVAAADDPPHRSSTRRWPALLPALFKVAALLALEAMSLGLFGWAVRADARVPAYVTSNILTSRGRTFVLLDMMGAVAVALGAAGAFLIATRGNGLPLLERLARRLAPLSVVGLIPFLMRWTLWTGGRDVDFLVLAAIFGLGTRAAVLTSLRAGPIATGVYERTRRGVATAMAASDRWVPPLIVLGGVAWYAIFFAYSTVANHHNLRTAAMDLGLEDNLIWNVLHGGRPFFKSSPGFGPTGSHFGFHATFFAYVIAGIYWFAQRSETLLVLQATTIALAAIPLFLIARRHLGPWAGAMIALCYILYPPVHGSNLYDFHYIPLGPAFLWLTLWLLEERRDWWAVLAIIFTLSIREDVAAGLVIVGLYLSLTGQRPRAGPVVAAIAGAYFVLLKLVLMPRALHGSEAFIHQYAGLLPAGEHGFGGVLKTVVANPVFTLNSLLERDKLVYVLQIAVPLCFIPWLGPIGLLCSLPGFFFTLLATQYPPLIQISFQYTAHWTAYLFLALIWNLARMGRNGDRAGLLRRRAWMVALGACVIVTTHQYGALLQQNTVRGGFGTYIFQTTAGDRERYAQLKQLIKLVPPRAKIVSTETVVPHVSQRPDSYTLRMGLFDADWILAMIPVRGDELNHVTRALESNEFGVVKFEPPFLLAHRGHPTTQNAETLRKIR